MRKQQQEAQTTQKFSCGKGAGRPALERPHAGHVGGHVLSDLQSRCPFLSSHLGQTHVAPCRHNG